MKIFRTLLVGIIGAFAVAVVGLTLLPALGVTLGANAALWLAVGGFLLGAAASQLESKALYVILMLAVIFSSFAVFFGSTLPAGSWIGQLVAKVAASSNWITWAIWFGAHIIVAVLLSQWAKDPTLSVAEAVGQTVEAVTRVVAAVTGSITGGILTGLFAAITSNPWVLVAAAAGGLFFLSSRGIAGDGQLRAKYDDSSLLPRSAQTIPVSQRADDFAYAPDMSVPSPLTPRAEPAPPPVDPFFQPMEA